MRALASIALAAVIALGGVASAEQPRSAKAETRLAKALAGKTAGAPVTCLPIGTKWNSDVIDDHTVLFRYGSQIYRNDPPQGCPQLGTSFYTLVTRTPTRLCRGDIATVVDIHNGTIVGSCSLGAFVPYR